MSATNKYEVYIYEVSEPIKVTGTSITTVDGELTIQRDYTTVAVFGRGNWVYVRTVV